MSIYDEVFNLCNNLGKGIKIKDYKHINLKTIKPNYINRIMDNAEKINELYILLYNSNLPSIQRTPSGGIAVHNIHHASCAYDIEEVYTEKDVFKGIIITVIIKTYLFVFNCGMFSTDKSTLSGAKAFNEFKKECKRYNIDITKYYIDNGKAIKETIPSPKIKFNNKYMYKRLQHVNHIDLNHAWSAGLVNEYPEFKPVMEALNNKDKLLSSIALGFMQSQYINYKLAHFAKAGIVWCNNKIFELMQKLYEQDFEVIGINTDGIWYIDLRNENRLYHDEEERPGIGYYKTDHIDCELAAYGNGQYWFKENGKFNVRARGYYIYEQQKPRELWDEIDFDMAMRNEASIKFIKGRGFVIHYVTNR